jgi:hypothetical protein
MPVQILGKQITGKEIVIAIVFIVVFAVLFNLEYHAFEKEAEKEPVINLDNDEKNPDYIQIRMQITGFDPVKGDVTLRLNPEPKGKLLGADEYTVTKDITIFTNSTTGKSEQNFSKGKRMNPFEMTVDMYDGSVMNYPYDKFHSELNIYVTTQEKDSAENMAIVPVPMVKETDFYSSMQGYRVTDIKEKNEEDGYSEIEFNIERTASVKMFSRFMMILMWFMTLAVVLVIASIIIRKRKIEYSMFAFLSAMLFALPALRNVQPFIPTIGCLSDYVSFFWAEAIVAAGLIVMVFTWLKRPGPKQ